MKISFENFGVINKGEIEQKPLTILCGENNTGKTYAMYALYRACKTKIFRDDTKLLAEITNNFEEKSEISFNLIDFIEKNSLKIQKIISTYLSKNIDYFFTSTNLFNNSLISIIIDHDTLIKNALRLSINSQMSPDGGQSFNIRIIKNSQNPIVHLAFPPHNTKPKIDAISYMLMPAIVSIFTEVYSRDILIFPAERAGFNIFHQELNAYRTHLLHNFNQHNLNLITAKYPKPIADYIDWLNLIPNYKNQKSELFSSLSTTLQNNILGGSYSLDETNSINFHLNNQKDTLPLHLTSSTVKTYFGLWFYLQHMAQEGDVLMIDEPELSLHPNNQRKIARLLAQLVNKGIKVVISTHSDYIVKEINSLIMLSQDNKNRSKLMARFGIEEDEILSPDKVGAYLFKDNTIKAMEITNAEGIIATTFDDVIRDLSEETQTIFYEYLDEEDDE
jgi:predicted ATPase